MVHRLRWKGLGLRLGGWRHSISVHSEAECCWDPISLGIPYISLSLAGSVLKDLQYTPFPVGCPKPSHLLYSPHTPCASPTLAFLAHPFHTSYASAVFLQIPSDNDVAYSFIIFQCLLKCCLVIKAFSNDAIILFTSLHGIHYWFLRVICTWHILSIAYFLQIRMKVLWKQVLLYFIHCYNQSDYWRLGCMVVIQYIFIRSLNRWIFGGTHGKDEFEDAHYSDDYILARGWRVE